MLGFVGKWAGSKGMGKIPNLEGLSLNEARNAITNAGFNLGNETSRGNGNGATSSNHGKAKGRDDTDSLLDYESVIDFDYYSYTPVSVSPSVSPVGVSPVGVVPVGVSPAPECGPCQAYTETAPTCNGEDSYVGNYSGTRQTCSDGTYVICTGPNFVSYGALIEANNIGCGGTGTVSPVGVTPVGTGCTWIFSGNEIRTCNGSPTTVAVYYNSCDYTQEQWTCPDVTVSPVGVTPAPNCNDTNTLGQSDCAGCGLVWDNNLGECVTPSVSPVGVSPVDCTPVYSYREHRSSCGQAVDIYVNPCTNAESYTCPSVGVTPVGVSPVGVTPVGVSPVGVTPVGVSPVGVTPVGVSPAACTGTAQQICQCEGGIWRSGGCLN